MLEDSHYYFRKAAEILGLSEKIRDILLTPFRVVKVEIVIEDDQGALKHFLGYRAQHNKARGPLKGGVYVLRARPLKGPYSVSDPIRVTSPAKDVRIVLRKGHVLAGQVADMGSRRFRAFWLRPDGKGGWTHRRANCDREGRFRLESLSPERGRLFVHRDGDDRMAYLEDVDPARGDIEIELQRGSTIEVPTKCYFLRSRFGMNFCQNKVGLIPKLLNQSIGGSKRAIHLRTHEIPSEDGEHTHSF